MKNLIKRILKEEFDSENFEWAEESQFTPAEQFIYEKFKECKLEPIQSGTWKGWMRYVDKKGDTLFIDNINTADEDTVLYFDYDKIHKKLIEMGLEDEQIEKLCIDMLYETHKRKVLTAFKKIYFPI